MNKSQYIKLVLLLPTLPWIKFIDISKCCSHAQLWDKFKADWFSSTYI